MRPLVCLLLVTQCFASSLCASTFHSFMGAEDGRIYAVGADGTLWFYWHLSSDNTPVWANGGVGAAIGSSWQTFTHTLYGGNGIIYGVDPEGALYYYRDLARNGTVNWANGGAGVSIGEGWNIFKWVLGDGDGVIYAIDSSGAFLFYRHLSQDERPIWANGGLPQQIGNGWQNFRTVFAGHNGVVFAVTQDGTLYYYRDLARNGTFLWENGGSGLVIGTGWNRYVHLFSTGNGRIYGVDAMGGLFFYRVTITGTTATWDYGGVGQQVGSGFETESLQGYCWPLSAAPGEVIDFKISGQGEGTVRFYRHIADAAGLSSTLMGQTTFVPTVQSVPADPVRDGCGWSTSVSWTIPMTWPSGMYSAVLTSSGGGRSDITFVVKPRPNARSQIAVLANANTWLAYNGWGGSSKYTGRSHVSFLRPAPGLSPVSGDLHLARAELWVLGWLEHQGFHPDLYSDLDFHNGIDLRPYKCLVLNTHPEYWTLQMYAQLESYLNAGGSVLYLGGNGIFEEGEYTSDQTGMIFLAGVEGGDRSAAYFRNLTPAKPEYAVLGVGYNEDAWGTAAPYQVLQPTHPFFEGTGLRLNDTFGETGLNTTFGGGAASGWEVDNIDGSGVPARIMVLATGQNAGTHGADMTYYPHLGGGFVFSAGSLQFGGSLAIDSRIQRIVHNAIDEACSPVRRLTIEPQLPAFARLRFRGRPGAAYQIQTATPSLTSAWNPVATLLLGTNTSASLTVPIPNKGGFFRALQLP